MTLENIFIGGIFRNQVQILLNKIASMINHKVSLVVILPIIKRENGKFYRMKKLYGENIAQLQKECDSNNIQLIFINVPLFFRHNTMNIILLPLLIVWSLPRIIRVIYINKVDIIHCRSYLSSLLGVLAKLVTKKQVIFDMRGLFIYEGVITGIFNKDTLNYKVWLWIEEKIFQLTDQIVILSDTFKEYIPKEYLKKTRLVYANVDEEYFTDQIVEKQSEIVSFIYTGSLGHWHELNAIFKIYSEFRKFYSKSKLVILSVVDTNEFQAGLTKYNIPIQEVDVFTCKPSEVKKHLFSSHFGILPLNLRDLSFEEEWVAKTMISSKGEEYMAAGLQVIFHNSIGGMKYIHDQSHPIGIEYPLKNTVKLNEIELFNKDNKNYAEKNFNLLRNVEKYSEIYKEGGY